MAKPGPKPSPRTENSAKSKSAQRKLKRPSYTSFRISKRIKHDGPKIRSALGLFRLAVGHLWVHKKIFSKLFLVYALLTIVFVRGFGGGVDIRELQDSLSELFSSENSTVTATLVIFGALLSDAGTAVSETAGVYQSILLVIMSLSVIWVLRQTSEGRAVSLRDAFYKSQHPLVPFLLVAFVISLQLIPMVVGSLLYGLVISGGLAVTVAEQAIWVALIFLLVLLSLYMVTASLFALYIVTLPNIMPLQAIRSSRDLVRFRRWTVLRKLLFLPLALLLFVAAITLPVILFIPVIAVWTVFVLGILSLFVSHSYIYSLYREML